MATAGCSISLDERASTVANSEIIKRHREGRPVSFGRAFGPDGEPTTDPGLALRGMMAPAGGYKGVAPGGACRGYNRRYTIDRR
jgi:(2R)-3-sulfolactate dehydrogenase (NADP+)